MTDPLFRRIVLPVASVEDAETTVERVLPRLHDDAEVLAVHVVEKAGGAPDKASVEQREDNARTIFEVVENRLGAEGITLDTEILYGTDVAETIVDAAREFDASAIVFTPRGGSRWVKLLTGDTATGLIERADRPVVVLPDRTDDATNGSTKRPDRTHADRSEETDDDRRDRADAGDDPAGGEVG